MVLYIKLFCTLALQVTCAYARSQAVDDVIPAQIDLIENLTGSKVPANTHPLTDRSSYSHRKAAADFLSKSLEEISLSPEKHKYAYPNINFFVDLLFDPFRGTNVYAVIPSTAPSDEYVILGAHYDSEPGSPGADDNASGVALVFEVGKKLMELERRDRNFMLVFFDQEENDEVGSKAFVRKILKEGLNVHSVHVADMVGWDSDGDRAVELAPSFSDLIDVYREVATGLEIPVYTSNVSSSDHKSFYDGGYTVVLITEEYTGGDFNPNYHSPEDKIEHVDFEYLAGCTELVFGVMKKIATKTQLTNYGTH